MNTETLTTLATLTKEIDGDARLSVCLVGPTGSGKTSRARQIAAALNLPLVRLLPGTEREEDILGYPQPNRERTAIVPLPRAELLSAIKKPTLLLIDELDKAREEVLSGLLTLLAERRVRNVELHQDSVIICAMQPVDPAAWLSTETGKALAARLIFIPVDNTAAIDRLRSRYHMKYHYARNTVVEELPILPTTSPRQWEWATEFAIRALPTWHIDDIVTVLRGVINACDIEPFLNDVRGSACFDSFEVLKQAGRLHDWAEHAAAGELPVHCAEALTTDWRAGLRALARIVLELDAEIAPRVVETILKDVTNRVEMAGGVLEFDPTLDEERGVIAFRKVCTWLGEALIARQNDRQPPPFPDLWQS